MNGRSSHKPVTSAIRTFLITVAVLGIAILVYPKFTPVILLASAPGLFVMMLTIIYDWFQHRYAEPDADE